MPVPDIETEERKSFNEMFANNPLFEGIERSSSKVPASSICTKAVPVKTEPLEFEESTVRETEAPPKQSMFQEERPTED